MIKSGKFPDYFPESTKKAAMERQAEMKKVKYNKYILVKHFTNKSEICL